ncbi:MAG TPA: hypothetical protein DEH22_01110 [Chloroflexi bacterium]|nr:hypothetical protein [Chloroflexota bacterium]
MISAEKKNFQSRKFPGQVVNFLFWGAIVGVIAFYSSAIPLGFDESYNLNLAVTIAEYNRYATHFADGFRHFDPAISTGPALMILLGLWFKFIEPSFASVRIFMGVLFLLSLIFLYEGVRVWLGHRVARITTIGFLLLPLVLFWGSSAQGDIWAVGWVCLSFFFLKKGIMDAHQTTRPWLWLFISGLCLGMAVLTKTIIFLLIPALIVSAIISGYQRRSGWRLSREMFPSLLAVLMFTLWQLFQKLVLRWLAAPEVYSNWLQTSANRNSMMMQVVIFNPLSHPYEAWSVSFRDFGPFLLAFAVAAALAFWQRHAETPLWDLSVHFERIALIGAATYFFWFCFLSGEQANNRHLILGYFLILVLIVKVWVTLWFSEYHLVSWTRFFAVGLLALLLGWGISKGVKIDQGIYQYGHHHQANQNVVSLWVQKNILLTEPIGGVGWFVPWDIVFLTGHLPFQMDVLETPFQGWGNWLILTPELSATGNLTDDIQHRIDLHGTLMFQEDGYQIYYMEKK